MEKHRAARPTTIPGDVSKAEEEGPIREDTTKAWGEILAPGIQDVDNNDNVNWFDSRRARDLLERAWKEGSVERGVEQARAWATDANGKFFEFSEQEKNKDARELERLDYDLDRLIASSHDKLRGRGRLSRESLERTLTEETVHHLRDKDDIARAYDLVDGIKIPTCTGFIPQEQPEKLRATYKLAKPAILKLLHKQAIDGTILMLPTELLMASKHSHKLHYQCIGWTKKKGEACGRVTGDMSYTTWPFSLNGVVADQKNEVRDKIIDKWGDIHLPTLLDIVHDILRMVDAHGWDDISLFKKDIAAAFHRLLFHPECVSMTAFAIDEWNTILHLVANFGWTGTPNAWDVIGRIMLAAACYRIAGTLKLYVDDFFGACLTALLAKNNKIVDDVIVNLLGEEALAPHKDKQGRQLVILGWLFDLDTRTVAISEENLLRTLHAFMAIDTRAGVSLVQLERAASMGTRYAVLCRQMAQFTVAIYKDIAMFRGNRMSIRSISEDTRVDIAAWLAYLTLSDLSPERFARDLESFRPKPPAAVNIGFDGSLRGAGVGVRNIRGLPEVMIADQGVMLGFAGVHPLPCLPTTDSAYQNTFELMSFTLGLLVCAYLGLQNFSFNSTGDSKTTLAWIEDDRVNSAMGRRAGIAYSIIASTIGAHNTGTLFVLSKKNKLMDDLSRGVTSDETRALSEQLRFPCEEGSPAWEILRLCDPLLPPLTWNETVDFINTISRLLADVQAAGVRSRRKDLQSSKTSGSEKVDR